MKDRNYRVNIRNIYVGIVQNIDLSKLTICHDFPYINFDNNEEELRRHLQNKAYLFRKGKDFIDYEMGWPIDFGRSMLFTLDGNNHADDLLYDSPHYPVFNISPNEDCLSSSISVVDDAFELYEVLKFLGYPEEIGYEEVLNLRKTLFSCDYVMNHCKEFGIIETAPERTAYDGYDSKGNYRTFNDEIEEFSLPRCHFDGIMMCKDHYSPVKGVIDSFKPCDEEGIVKSLGTITRN